LDASFIRSPSVILGPEWDGLATVFDQKSGHSWLLSPESSAVLGLLTAEPQSTEMVLALLSRDFDVELSAEGGHDAISQLRAQLMELADLGLVQTS
jgi:PqqD family protein of HPr-rel-A system